LSSSRIHAGSDTALWTDLRKLWKELARVQLTFWDNDDDEEAETDGAAQEKENGVRTLCQATAKFTRNIVAGVPENQARA